MLQPSASPLHGHRWWHEAEEQCPHRLQLHGLEHRCAPDGGGTCPQCAMKLPVTQEVVCPDCGARSHPPH